MAEFQRYWIFQQDYAPIPWAGSGLRTIEAKVGHKWVMLRGPAGAKKRVDRSKWDKLPKAAAIASTPLIHILASLRAQLGDI